jgi:Phytanoyl-CoA dioxygenase (PhyH)
VRPVFTDEHLERQLDELGYVVVDVLDRDGVAELAQLHATTCDGDPAGVQFTTQYPAGGAKAVIREGLVRAYRRDLAELMHPQDVVVAAFITKGRSGDSTIPVHLDWSIVDETHDCSVNVWIPLCDTHESNGALAMLPGSHRLPLTRRGTDTPPALDVPPELMHERMTLLPMRAGQAVIYDHRTIHGSAANTSGEPRVAAVMSLVPAGTALVHYLGADDGELRELQVDAGFFDAYVVDPDSDRGPNADALAAGRPTRVVRATAPITADDIRALGQ